MTMAETLRDVDPDTMSKMTPATSAHHSPPATSDWLAVNAATQPSHRSAHHDIRWPLPWGHCMATGLEVVTPEIMPPFLEVKPCTGCLISGIMDYRIFYFNLQILLVVALL